MTLDELDLVHRDAAWLIAKRSGWSVAKAMTMGTESLEKLIDKIGDLYDLSPAERRKLRPSIASDTHEGAGTVITTGKGLVGLAVGPEGMMKAARNAYKAGRISKTFITLIKSGPKAAQTVANTGRVAAKANPVAMALTIGWAVGSTGWIIYHATRFNSAAYRLVADREGLELENQLQLSKNRNSLVE